jgi:hypothetical protein
VTIENENQSAGMGTYKAGAALADWSIAHIAAFLPLFSELFAIRHRGHHKIWRNQG